MSQQETGPLMINRFRGFLPVVVDVETGGLDPTRHALLEIGAVILGMDEQGRIHPASTHHFHVEPFPGAELDPKALEFTGIDPDHPFRFAVPEKEALQETFRPIRLALRETGCHRAILVGHNAFFDLGFINAAVSRTGCKRNPFHPFSSFDTATLGGLAYGQTVLSRALRAAGLEWDAQQAHSALYDAERTAELFCIIVNRWDSLNGGMPDARAGQTGA